MRLLCFVITVLYSALASAAPPPSIPRSVVNSSLKNALEYLRSVQHPDGSYGTHQRRLQTSLTVLAFLSQGETPDLPDSPLPKALTWLIDNTTDDGFLGDSEFPMESHAVVGLALSESLGMVQDQALARQLTQRAETAYEYSLNVQDRAVGADYYGGWKANAKVKINDRRVTAWVLLFLRSMQLRGHKVNERALERALDFMEGSQKIAKGSSDIPREDLGGFSYDAAGLPVVSVTSAGFACMAIYNRDRQRRKEAVEWLRRNRPIWYGPNFYLSYFFAARGYSRERHLGADQARAADDFYRRMWELLREHQQPDGSFIIPPGNAENTREMGTVYATAMAVLILNADRDLMPIDATD